MDKTNPATSIKLHSPRVYNHDTKHMAHDTLRSLLSPHERRLFERLTSPQLIQDYLDRLPINFELHHETYMSPRRVIRSKTAHCFEGALFAATVLMYHGQRPLLMDLRTTKSDQDHVVALYRFNGYWGAISKTNHASLRYRDPLYQNIRELALSYAHEYFLSNGKKTFRAYSCVFDVSPYALHTWLTAEDELVWLVDALDNARHFPIAPKKNMRKLRNVSPLERTVGERTEWRRNGTKRPLRDNRED